MYEYRAVIRSVHDGDSFRADIDLGFGVILRDQPLRVALIDAPELGTDAGRAARDYLRTLLPTGCEVVIRTVKDRREKYGRLLAQITGLDGVDVTTLLIAAGHAKPWDGQGPRP
ncbi:MAG: micrococcal nuclease [Hyphomicrobiales bacterium]|nr:micrococcal nuclease [Hyphomicrobiales bacterium]